MNNELTVKYTPVIQLRNSGFPNSGNGGTLVIVVPEMPIAKKEK